MSDIKWEFKRETNNATVQLIPEGPHRVRIRKAEKKVSRAGNDMLALQLDVSGYSGRLYYYIPFLVDKPEVTNSILTQFFDSFHDIECGDCNLSHWIGQKGAAMVKHEEYNGKPSAKINYFIQSNKQKDLPEWQTPFTSSRPSSCEQDTITAAPSHTSLIS